MKNNKIEFFKCNKCGMTPEALIESWSLNADQPFEIKALHLAHSSKGTGKIVQLETIIKSGSKNSLKTKQFIYCFDCHQPMKRCENMNVIQQNYESEPF